METIISSAITGIVAILVCLINNSVQSRQMRTMLEYRINELTKRVEKHNSVVERVYNLEQSTAVTGEKIAVINHRIEDLEKDS